MKIYFAPLEGITGYVFRNAYEKYYGGIDKYFTPFISPHTKKLMDSREKRDILPENNQGMNIVPQVLTNKAEDLIDLCKQLHEDYGYTEVNLNLGCPSKTVTTKGKGSGFLEYPNQMEEFFDRFFKVSDVKLSIKTRIGYSEVEEAERLFHLYERFPFEEVIIHPRLGSQMYKGTPYYDVFENYLEKSKHSLCYNGDINSLDDLHSLDVKWENCDKFMLGRGLIARPNMLKETSCLAAVDKKQSMISQSEWLTFLAFHDELVEGYYAYMCEDRNTLFKMKELWTWWAVMFPGQEKTLKKIKKVTSLQEYRLLVNSLGEKCMMGIW
ncbi:MAG: tRNA-dihydrouridine synthase family protein [Agathobacter sp.]|nr:tRNA-dihydrouridine synthase family protein [Agathobacter sp.]